MAIWRQAACQRTIFYYCYWRQYAYAILKLILSSANPKCALR
jgi:hypothetical protein